MCRAGAPPAKPRPSPAWGTRRSRHRCHTPDRRRCRCDHPVQCALNDRQPSLPFPQHALLKRLALCSTPAFGRPSPACSLHAGGRLGSGRNGVADVCAVWGVLGMASSVALPGEGGIMLSLVWCRNDSRWRGSEPMQTAVPTWTSASASDRRGEPCCRRFSSSCHHSSRAAAVVHARGDAASLGCGRGGARHCPRITTKLASDAGEAQ